MFQLVQKSEQVRAQPVCQGLTFGPERAIDYWVLIAVAVQFREAGGVLPGSFAVSFSIASTSFCMCWVIFSTCSRIIGIMVLMASAITAASRAILSGRSE